MAAMAIDISTRNLTNEGTAKLVQRLSEEGFSRMSVYNTFVHADIKDMGTYRGNWTGNYRGSSAIRRAMEIHLADGFRSGTQRVIPQQEGGTVSAETETTPNELAQVDSPDSPAATDTQDTDTTTRENTSDTPGEVQANPQQTENARLLLEQREQQRAEQAAAAAAAAANAPATENGVDLGITQAEYRALSGRERYELRKRTPGTNAYERALRGNAP